MRTSIETMSKTLAICWYLLKKKRITTSASKRTTETHQSGENIRPVGRGFRNSDIVPA
jgi:hypothetical protein